MNQILPPSPDAAQALIRSILDNEDRRLFYSSLCRVACGGRVSARAADLIMRAFTPAAGTLGASVLPTDVSREILDLADIYGVAQRNLGFTPMSAMFTRFASSKRNPKAVFITPSAVDRTIPADSQLTGNGLTPEANTIAVRLTVSEELLFDEKADLSYFLLTKFAQGLAAAIDTAAFVGTGADDQTNGLQTGIFVDGAIPNVSAARGNNAVAQLQRVDFVNCIAAVAPAALQRPCRWFISSALMAPLLQLKDGQGPKYLLRPPTSQDDEWRLCGFPVSWSAACPAVDQPSQKIAAFGYGPSYMVAIREELEVVLSFGNTGFRDSTRDFHALARGFCQTREASGLATLSLSVA